MSVQKGKPGYIDSQKKKFMIWTLLAFAFAVIIFVIGTMVSESKLNLFTLIAVIGCIPAIKMLIQWIKYISYKTIESAKAREIGDPVLSKRSEEIDINNINQEVLDLIEDLKECIEFYEQAISIV